MKTCSRCGNNRSGHCFRVNWVNSDGLDNWCKDCCPRSLAWIAPPLEQSSQSSYKTRKNSAKNARRRVRKQGTLAEGDLRLSAEWRKAIREMPCYYCGVDDLWVVYHIDHRIPISKGGDDSWVNLVRACESCNLRKSAKTDAEFLGWG